MKRQLVLASHGNLSSGILSSLQLICGNKEDIITLDCYMTENFDLQQEVKSILKNHEAEELIVITDIFGGSVNNAFMEYIDQPNFYLITGMNLPFLIEFVSLFESCKSIKSLILETLETSKESIQFCNELLTKSIKEEDF